MRRRTERPRGYLSRRIYLYRLAAVVVGLFGASVALASGDPADLGKPTSARYSILPVGSFTHEGPLLRRHGVVELLFLGTQWDPSSAVERWPVVKALDSFGKWSNLSPSTSHDLSALAGTPATYPTFDWLHAGYRSPYLVFVHKDVADGNDHPLQRLSPEEQRLYRRYAKFLMVSVDGYTIGGSGFAFGDFSDRLGGALSFGTVQTALQRDDVSTYYSLVTDVNAEANVITALICHADHLQPKQVCSRAAIKQILKSVK